MGGAGGAGGMPDFGAGEDDDEDADEGDMPALEGAKGGEDDMPALESK
jgi:hypothetical protein